MTSAQSRISVELVPRSAGSVREEMADVSGLLPWVDTINIPDLVKFDLRSWEATRVAGEAALRPDGSIYPRIPHIRAADVNPEAPLPMAQDLLDQGVDEVLVVSGDDADYFTHHTYPVDAVDVIRRFRAELPQLTVYASLDPYRSGMAQELRYLERKLAAGASGIFTQPFFDTHLMGAWASVLPTDIEVWWGATTVTTKASIGYWRRRNLVAFPTSFEPTLQWQREFARRALDFARERSQHIYLMPVRTSVKDYLDGVL